MAFATIKKTFYQTNAGKTVAQLLTTHPQSRFIETPMDLDHLKCRPFAFPRQTKHTTSPIIPVEKLFENCLRTLLIVGCRSLVKPV